MPIAQGNGFLSRLARATHSETAHLQRRRVLESAFYREARLTAAVAASQSLDEYAETAGISIGTARWTLKRVLAKTGCRRQAELVQRVVTSIAGLNPET